MRLTRERCPLPLHLFEEIRTDSDWEVALRHFEIQAMMKPFPAGGFANALELGCGNGGSSLHLEDWCHRLTATDYDALKFRTAPTSKTSFVAIDAQELSPFQTGAMDLIFSSNLLEHLPDVEKCLRDCTRVLKRGGYAVHMMPNRTWKCLNLLLFYPLLVQGGCMKLLHPLVADGGKPHITVALDDNLHEVIERRSLVKRLLPQRHGFAKSHVDEWLRWNDRRWLRLFEASGLEVLRVVHLPFYFGHGYVFRRLLRLGNRLGLSSSTGYVMVKR